MKHLKLIPSIAVASLVLAPAASAVTLVEYGFQPTPTASQVDPDVLAPDVSATDISEFGDPDQGGSSPDLTNFAGASLNIKRAALDDDLSNFSDYTHFTVSAANPGELLNIDSIDFNFNQFSNGFAFEIFTDVGDGNGFVSQGVVGNLSNGSGTLAGDNSALAFQTDINNPVSFDLSGVPVASSVDFRLEYAHFAPDTGGNTSLQHARIIVDGAVIPEPSTYALIGGALALAVAMFVRRRRA